MRRFTAKAGALLPLRGFLPSCIQSSARKKAGLTLVQTETWPSLSSGKSYSKNEQKHLVKNLAQPVQWKERFQT